LDLRCEIARDFKADIFIDKDANIGLYSEKWLGVGRSYNDILYIYTRNYEKGQMGVGVSFYLGGKIYRGSNYSSGEIGLAHKREEKKEIFEPFSSYEAMPSLERLVKMRPLREGTFLKQLLKKNELNFATIIEAARQNDREAEDILEDIGLKIGRGVAFLVNLINPQLVIIGGDFAQAQDVFHKSLKKSIFNYGFEFSVKGLEIKPASRMDGLTGVRQAAFLVVGNWLNFG
jgi:predicted NBD/HSP70 family sugar kinase